WAESADGYLDVRRENNDQGIHWLTTPEAKVLTHNWRAQESAILVGRRTIEVDNPSLTVRAITGPQPLRCILDPSGKLDGDFTVLTDEHPTLVFNSVKNDIRGNKEWIKVDSVDFLKNVMKILHEKKMLSVYVEGGANTIKRFLEVQLWDESRILTGPHFFGQPGLKVITPTGRLADQFTFHGNQVKIIRRV
ncbi:MAG: RibD family protein, partial [Bacteroidota bacterium]